MANAIRGGAEFKAALEGRALAAQAVTEITVEAAAKVVERATVDKLMQKEHAKGTPTPSAPGEPPAMISGHLKASVKSTPVRNLGGATFEARVGPTAVYARIQELGGHAGRGGRAHLPARPYLRPALEESIPEIEALFITAWRALGSGLRV